MDFSVQTSQVEINHLREITTFSRKVRICRRKSAFPLCEFHHVKIVGAARLRRMKSKHEGEPIKNRVPSQHSTSILIRTHHKIMLSRYFQINSHLFLSQVLLRLYIYIFSFHTIFSLVSLHNLKTSSS